VRQDFPDQAMLKMPEIMDTDLVYLETLGQMRANGFYELANTLAETA
jgi:hypothetical protein